MTGWLPKAFHSLVATARGFETRVFPNHDLAQGAGDRVDPVRGERADSQGVYRQQSRVSLHFD